MARPLIRKTTNEGRAMKFNRLFLVLLSCLASLQLAAKLDNKSPFKLFQIKTISENGTTENSCTASIIKYKEQCHILTAYHCYQQDKSESIVNMSELKTTAGINLEFQVQYGSKNFDVIKLVPTNEQTHDFLNSAALKLKKLNI